MKPSFTAITGVPTGFVDLDEKTAGFQKGDLIIVDHFLWHQHFNDELRGMGAFLMGRVTYQGMATAPDHASTPRQFSVRAGELVSVTLAHASEPEPVLGPPRGADVPAEPSEAAADTPRLEGVASASRNRARRPRATVHSMPVVL